MEQIQSFSIRRDPVTYLPTNANKLAEPVFVSPLARLSFQCLRKIRGRFRIFPWFMPNSYFLWDFNSQFHSNFEKMRLKWRKNCKILKFFMDLQFGLTDVMFPMPALSKWWFWEENGRRDLLHSSSIPPTTSITFTIITIILFCLCFRIECLEEEVGVSNPWELLVNS